MNHKYQLEPYKGKNSRHICPKCHSRERSFALYIDMETGQPVHESVGRCNHETGCGYHLTPKEYFQENNISADEWRPRKVLPAPTIAPSYIDINLFKSTLREFDRNNFTKYLIALFGDAVTNELIKKYLIGTSKHWPGSTIFWQMDQQGKIRTGKIMLYNPISGRRVKEPFSHIHWVHSLLKASDYGLKQCLFGEHLLTGSDRPVGIVESEKTAIIASAYLPDLIWLASGSLQNLNTEKCSVLKGRKVILFPDLNGFNKWSEKAKELNSRMDGAKFTVSDLLHKNTDESEKSAGYDLADYLIKFDLNQFRKSKHKQQPANLNQQQAAAPLPQWYRDFDLIAKNHFDRMEKIHLLPSMVRVSNCDFINSLDF